MTILSNLFDTSNRLIEYNGSVTHSKHEINDTLLCIFTKLVRNLDDSILKDLILAFKSENIETLEHLVVLWWQTRATRGHGKGERKLFYSMIPYLIDVVGKEVIVSTIHLIPHYGYYKDFCFILEQHYDTELDNEIINIYTKQLRQDLEDMNIGKNISLAAKFAPSEKSHFSKIAIVFAKTLFPNEKDYLKKYRHMKTRLNNYLCTTEVLITQNRWEEVKFENITSICLHRNKQQLSKHADITSLNNINSTQLFPHDIISDILYSKTLSNEECNVLQKQWKSIVSDNSKNTNLQSCIPMIDLSGSMNGLPISAGIGLGLLISEISHGPFRNLIMTFSDHPEWVEFEDNSNIVDKVLKIKKQKWNEKTNFIKAMDMILSIVEDSNSYNRDIPKALIVFSDMKFDEAEHSEKYPWCTHYEIMKQKFRESGMKKHGSPYELPRIVFWNLNGNSVGYQVKSNDKNVQQFSGFHPCLLKCIHNSNRCIDKTFTSSEILTNIINDDNFLPIRDIIKDMKSGIFSIDEDFVII